MSPLPSLRTVWRAVSHPAAFFASLGDEPRLVPPILTLLLSATVAGVVTAGLLLRATGSDAVLPLLLGVPLAVLAYLAQISVLGSLMLLLPAGMDLRSFEVVLWAWVPVGILALSLLPIGIFAPWPTLLGGALLLVPAWHLWIVWRGVTAFATRRAGMATVLYVLVVFVFPSVLLAFTALVLSNLA